VKLFWYNGKGWKSKKKDKASKKEKRGIVKDTTRNTFCGTWYLPHSRVHKPMIELCA